MNFDALLHEAEIAHGHLCAGQILGVRMAMLGCERLGIAEPKGADRKRLVTFVEIDRCATDAIGVVTGCRLGKNDGGPLDDKDRARGSLRGIGDETQEIENPVMKKHETVHTYGWYMKQYVEEGRAKGATVIICSQVPRKIWKDGKITRDAATYAGWAHQVADMEHIQFIDLNEITARKYDALGQAAVEPLFGDEHTHTTLAGAIINAESVVQGLKALPDDPVAKDFSADGKALKAYVK
jgi:hypothetical protein